jgi:amino acid adenylation domain-containing protein
MTTRRSHASGPERQELSEHPLSAGQQALWFLHEAAPTSTAYNIVCAARLRGGIDVAVLLETLRIVFDRHPAFRTAYSARDGSPVQRIRGSVEFPIDVIDASGWSDEKLDRQLQTETQHPFDLEKDLLCRVQLYTRPEEGPVLLLSAHHIAFDGWSLWLCLKELASVYGARIEGLSLSTPPPRANYLDFVDRQKEKLAEPESEKLLAFWREQLAGDLPVLDLPTDRARPTAHDSRGAGIPFQLGRELTGRLEVLVKKENVTLNSLLLTTFQILLHRYSQQEEIIVGCPAAGRSGSEFRRTVGYFVNSLAIRGDLSGDPTFRALLGRTASTVRSSLEHQNYPFANLIDRLGVYRDPSRSPLFQACFVFQKPGDLSRMGNLLAVDDDRPLLGEEGLSIGPLTLLQREDQYDLSLEMAQFRGALSGVLKYRTDLFASSTAARMGASFRTLLEAVANSPDRAISELPLLTEAERESILEGWSDIASDPPPDRSLHEIFEEQAKRAPDAVALSFGSEELTFEELDGRANRLGRRLQTLGVGPDRIVGLCLNRGPEQMIALLAILKAGGAYLPLDPAYPVPRLEFMLKDSGAELLLTESGLADSLGLEGIETLCVDAPSAEREDDSRLVDVGSSEDLAFVIYTSGSTGKPKGVAMPHRAIANLIAWQLEETSLSEGARTLQFTSLSFDVSVQEIFTAWCSGGTLVLIEEEVRQDVERLASFIAEEKIERLFVPFVALQQLANEIRRRPRSNLALGEIITAGEQLHATPAIVRFFERLEGCALVNQYGPTESHVATAHRLVGKPCSWPTLPPIGKPIAGARIYLLDPSGEPVPIGVTGEIHIAGAGLARGYVGQPELTSERFIPHLFSDRSGARLYRTGDLARYRPDGDIEFLGRGDHQVKIRGFRVEPGEIEAVLCEHEAVREAVVVLHRGAPDEKRLVAHFVSGENATPSVRELQEFLSAHLPRHMVPTTFVRLDALPLTPSGKVDRAQLAAVASSSFQPEEVLEAPASPVEELLAGIWCEVLGLDRVGRDQNFFELGGHSLLATQVTSRVRRIVGVEIPLRAIFEAPTLAELSGRIEKERDADRARSESLPITKVDRDGGLPLSFSQERMWFLHQLAPESAAYNMGVGFRLTGPFKRRTAERCLAEIVKRHENLRTTFHSENGLPATRISEEICFDLELGDLRGLPAVDREDEARTRASDEIQRPFDLERGPLLRAVAYQLDDEDHVILFCMHHVVSDLWTFGVLFRELAELYAAGGPESWTAIPEGTLQYADFASWQRHWFSGEVLEEQLAYWKKQLAGASVLELPLDKPRPAVRGDSGSIESLELGPELVEQLKSLSVREGVTPFMTLLAIFKLLLMRSTGQKDVVVGSPIANRTRLELETMTGTFVNTLAMRTDLSGDPTFRELLHRVRETTLAAYAHQDLPFEKLVEELAPERDLSHSPVVQVLFNLANAPFEEPQIENLVWSPIELDRGAAQFDLSLFVDLEITRKAYVEFNTDLFEADTIKLFLRHYRNILQSSLEDPAQTISRVPLLDGEERERILVQWNGTESTYPEGACYHELFEARREKYGHEVAVIVGDEEITGDELNRRANCVARALRDRGARPGILVGIFMERSIDMVVALLGILKSGAAYVPLDPAFPAERLAFMIEDAGVPIVVTRKELAGDLPRSEAKALLLGANHTSPARETDEDLAPLAGPDDLAYVIYTSGSTGKPKGVEIQHRALINFLESMRREPGLEASDVLLAVTTLSFDIAALELYLPLVTGARVVICDRETAYDGRRLIELIESSEATVMQATPATWRLLIDSGWRGARGLKILCGGEALSRELADELLPRCKTLWNMYGPTETTIWSALWKVEAEGPISIGRPIANTEVYLLDSNLEPVPVGTPGELYIGGHGLARGYLDRPELSAEKFVPHPFDETPGARMHRTGDLARWMRDGRIECLDRIDNQVKIRGFRIDLGEIETALSASFDIDKNVVAARQDASGHSRLVAYVIPAEGASPTLKDLRVLLKRSLPDYMVPSQLVLLDRLPLTPNGKIDRLALPAPDPNRTGAEYPVDEPRTPVERELVTIWSEVLGIDAVGIHDDFFDLGGHSLLAARLADRIRRTFAIELPLRSIFEDFNVAGMASKLAYTAKTGTYQYHATLPRWASLVPIQPSGARPPLFLVSGTYSGEDAFLGYMANLVPHLRSDQPVFGFRARGLDGRQEPHQSAVEMARDYVAEMRTYQPEGPYVLGGECVGGVVAFEMARQLEQAGERVSLLVLLDTIRPSALKALLFRAYSLRRKIRSIRKHLGAIFQRDWKQGLEHVEELYKRKRRLHLPINQEERTRNRIERIESDYAAMMFRYRAEMYGGKLTLLLNEEQYAHDPYQGWQNFAKGGVESHEVPGNHLTRITEFVGETARALSACLDGVEVDAPGGQSQRVA